MVEEINYRTLRKIQQIEKNNPTTSKINSEFYQLITEYINKMQTRLNKEENNQKKKLLEDEIKNIKKITQSIYEQREKKIILSAISKARGGNPNLSNLENNEMEVFNQVLTILQNSRSNILKTNQKRNIKKPIENTQKYKEKQNSIILITQNIPEFIGTDTKKYKLKKGDILSISEDMTSLLINRNVAKKVKTVA